MINLAPPIIKQQKQAKSRLYEILTFYIIGIGIMVLGPLALLTYNFTLKADLDNLNNQVLTLERNKSNQATLISEAAFLEDRLKTAPTYQKDPKWDDILNQIAAATPTDTQITDIKMAASTKGTVFTLTGTTTDRRSIVLFADKLNENKRFVSATIDTTTDSSGASGKSFQFTIDFSTSSQVK